MGKAPATDLKKIAKWKKRDERRQRERLVIKRKLLEALVELDIYERGESASLTSTRFVYRFFGKFSKREIPRTRTSAIFRFSNTLHRLRMKNGVMRNLKLSAKRCEDVFEEIISKPRKGRKIDAALLKKGRLIIGALHQSF